MIIQLNSKQKQCQLNFVSFVVVYNSILWPLLFFELLSLLICCCEFVRFWTVLGNKPFRLIKEILNQITIGCALNIFSISWRIKLLPILLLGKNTFPFEYFYRDVLSFEFLPLVKCTSLTDNKLSDCITYKKLFL
jgi:hypothetical protein